MSAAIEYKSELHVPDPKIDVRLDADVEISPIASVFKPGGFKHAIKIQYLPRERAIRRGARSGVLKFLTVGSHAQRSSPLASGLIRNSQEKFAEEVGILQTLSGQQGVERIEYQGTCEYRLKDGEPQEAPYYISEYVERSQALQEFIESRPAIGLDFLFSFITKSLTALKACHSNKPSLLHLDLHWRNILIVPSEPTEDYARPVCERVVIIDFGLARRMADAVTPRDDPQTMVVGIEEFLHPDLKPAFRKRQPVHLSELTSKQARRFDLYSLAECFARAHAEIQPNDDEVNAYEGLAQIIEKLRNRGPEVTFDIDQALTAVARSEDVWKQPTLVRLAGGANVSLPMNFVGLLGCPEYQRLRGVYQLGLTHLVYPSATHSRFSHSLGTFDLCSRYISALLANSAVMRSMFEDRELEALRAAALLHDVGHYPFAHYLEELWREGVAPPSGLDVSHTSLGRKLLRQELKTDRTLGVDFEPWLNKILPRHPLDQLNAIWAKPVLRDLINGPIDCDKVDYLLRDGLACGVPYASSIDVARLLSSLTVVEYKNGLQLGVTPKGLAPVESILNARYHLFSEVYWHKACRGIAALVKHAFFLVTSPGPEAVSQAEFLNVMFARNCSDWAVLEWLSARLEGMGMPAEANDLVRRPLLQCDRQGLYKRLTTLCPIWDGEAEAYECLAKDPWTADYAWIVEVQNELAKALNAVLYPDRSPSAIRAHELLIDIPPARDRAHDYPVVRYPVATRGANEMSVREISGICTATRGAPSPLELTHKIRVFIARHHQERLKEVFKTSQDIGREIRTKIIAAVGSAKAERAAKEGKPQKT